MPNYHASISEEGRLYGHNINILKNYTEQLKNSAKIKAALDKLPAAEQERDDFFNNAPDNIQNAWFNERMGMSETDAMRDAAVSPAGYRAWKARFRKLDAAVSQYNGIVDNLTAENQRLADEASAELAKSGNGGGGGGDFTPTADDARKNERFKEEKEWKAKEEALNRISYATRKTNYEQYQQRILAIEEEYQQKILARQDLTEQERLEAQASFHEAQKKQTEELAKMTVAQEEELYSESVAMQKQRYIDGEIDTETYKQTLEMLELNHLRRMVTITKEGTKERAVAEKAYQDRLIADQQKRQQETEAAEKKHQDQLAKLKKEYFGDNRGERMGKYMADLENLKEVYQMELQAVAQTATAAINAYSSAAAVPVVGWVLAPIAAATAVAAGMLQVAAIKKQQEASQAQGYAEGGFTGDGGKYEVAGVVHKGEWVASKELLQSPVARPMIEALDFAQRTNTIGSLRSEDVSRTITQSVYAQSGQQTTPTVIVQQATPDAQTEIAAGSAFIREYADIMQQLKDRLNEPFVTVNTVTGDTGIKQAQDEYEQLMRNKTPKSRRS